MTRELTRLLAELARVEEELAAVRAWRARLAADWDAHNRRPLLRRRRTDQTPPWWGEAAPACA